jgi:hypothetical protein
MISTVRRDVEEGLASYRRISRSYAQETFAWGKMRGIIGLSESPSQTRAATAALPRFGAGRLVMVPKSPTWAILLWERLFASAVLLLFR